MNTDITVVDNALPVATAGTRTNNIMALMQQGIERGMTPEALGQLAALYERFAAKDAESQFLEAKRAFQAECPVIGKNKTADLGQGKASYRFADLEKIMRIIRPLLEAHGFSYDFAQEYDKEVVTVTCFLRHAAGHVEATKFSGPWATNAGMSAIQKSASATTFCQRYSLRLALGLPVGEDDDAPPEPHENPSARHDAPQVKPRGQREPEPVDDSLVSQGHLNALKREWVGLFGSEIGNDRTALREGFVFWCRRASGDDTWNPEQCSDWTQARIDAVQAKLPGGAG